MKEFHTIYVPKRLNSDILIACFLLQKFGEKTYSGIEKAQIEVVDKLPGDKEAWLLEDEGALSAFFKESSFPRGAGRSISRMVAEKLEIEQEYAVQAFLAIAEGRMKKEHESVSRLLATLIKQFANRPHKTYWTVRPVLKSQCARFEKQMQELPEKYTTAFEAGKVSADEITIGKDVYRVLIVESDDPAMTHFLHNHEDIQADIVCQKYISGDVHVSAHLPTNIDLSDVVAALRAEEIKQKEKDLIHMSISDLRVPGMVSGLEEWYFDHRNQDILHTPDMHDEKTYLSLSDIQKLIKTALGNRREKFFDSFTAEQKMKLTEEQKAFRKERLKQIENAVYELKKKDIVFMK